MIRVEPAMLHVLQLCKKQQVPKTKIRPGSAGNRIEKESHKMCV